MKIKGIVGLALMTVVLGMAGCSTEPSGGQLPPPRKLASAEEEAKKASEAAREAYSHMGKSVPGIPGAVPKKK